MPVSMTAIFTPAPVTEKLPHAVGAPTYGTPFTLEGVNTCVACTAMTPGRPASWVRFVCGTMTWMPL